MAALTTERSVTKQSGNDSSPDAYSVPVKAGAKIFAGSLVVRDAGYAAPGRTAANLIAIGRAEETVDNTGGANGDKTIRVRRGAFQFENSSAGDLIAETEVGKDVYIVDDQTVAKTDNTGARSRAGKVWSIEGTRVAVLVGIGY